MMTMKCIRVIFPALYATHTMMEIIFLHHKTALIAPVSVPSHARTLCRFTKQQELYKLAYVREGGVGWATIVQVGERVK